MTATEPYGSGGGGGSGGSIYLRIDSFVNTGRITAVGGKGGGKLEGPTQPGTASSGGEGGQGRIRIDGVGTKDTGVVEPVPALNLKAPVKL
jgi:hypothetical protein